MAEIIEATKNMWPLFAGAARHEPPSGSLKRHLSAEVMFKGPMCNVYRSIKA